MKVSQSTLHYFSQFNKENGFELNIPDVGRFWPGMSIYNITEQFDHNEQKCYLDPDLHNDSRYVLRNASDDEILTFTMHPVVENITGNDIEKYLVQDVGLWDDFSINDISMSITDKGIGFKKATPNARPIDTSSFEPYKSPDKAAAMSRAKEFAKACVKPSVNSKQRDQFSDKFVKSLNENGSEEKPPVQESESYNDDKELKQIKSRLQIAQNDRDHMVDDLYNDCPIWSQVDRRYYSLQDFVDKGICVKAEDGLPELNPDVKKYETEYTYEWNMYPNPYHVLEGEEKLLLGALKRNNINVRNVYLGDSDKVVGYRFDVTADVFETLPHYGHYELTGENQVFSRDGKYLNTVIHAMEHDDSIRNRITSIHQKNAEIRSLSIEFGSKRHEMEQEQDFADAVASIPVNEECLAQ